MTLICVDFLGVFLTDKVKELVPATFFVPEVPKEEPQQFENQNGKTFSFCQLGNVSDILETAAAMNLIKSLQNQNTNVPPMNIPSDLFSALNSLAKSKTLSDMARSQSDNVNFGGLQMNPQMQNSMSLNQMQNQMGFGMDMNSGWGMNNSQFGNQNNRGGARIRGGSINPSGHEGRRGGHFPRGQRG